MVGGGIKIGGRECQYNGHGSAGVDAGFQKRGQDSIRAHAKILTTPQNRLTTPPNYRDLVAHSCCLAAKCSISIKF